MIQPAYYLYTSNKYTVAQESSSCFAMMSYHQIYLVHCLQGHPERLHETKFSCAMRLWCCCASRRVRGKDAVTDCLFWVSYKKNFPLITSLQPELSVLDLFLTFSPFSILKFSKKNFYEEFLQEIQIQQELIAIWWVRRWNLKESFHSFVGASPWLHGILNIE